MQHKHKRSLLILTMLCLVAFALPAQAHHASPSVKNAARQPSQRPALTPSIVLTATGHLNIAQGAGRVQVVGSYAYVGGVHLDVVDVQNPAAPVLVTRYAGLTDVADGNGGLQILSAIYPYNELLPVIGHS